MTLLADSQYQWYYWIAPILAVGLIGVLVLLSVGYVRRVLIPRYRGKRVE